MLIIADENIPAAKEVFSAFGEVHTLHGRGMTAADVQDADVLLVRSVTRIDSNLLSASRVRFVGSATIGTDHVDLDWLESQRIAFANAPACNAVSAAEYVFSSLLHVMHDRSLSLDNMTLGIIGCGNVGSRVQRRAEAMGIRCLICDPPRAEREGPEGFVSMQEIAAADIVSVHVPLVREGPYRTRNLIDQEFIARLKPDSIFINTSRGDVVNEAALKATRKTYGSFGLILDVWNNEPIIDVELARLADIATPHIAGYSIDGKLRATSMLYQALCDFTGKVPTWDMEEVLPGPDSAVISLAADLHRMDAIRYCLEHVYDITADHQRLLASLDEAGRERGIAFDRLRKEYPPRRECSAYRVEADTLDDEVAAALSAFGFVLNNQ